MALIKEALLVENGTHTLPVTPVGLGVFLLTVRGAFGGGTLTPGVVVEDDSGDAVFVPLTGITALTAAGEIDFVCGATTQPAVQLTGATGPSIRIAASGAY